MYTGGRVVGASNKNLFAPYPYVSGRLKYRAI